MKMAPEAYSDIQQLWKSNFKNKMSSNWNFEQNISKMDIQPLDNISKAMEKVEMKRQ